MEQASITDSAVRFASQTHIAFQTRWQARHILVLVGSRVFDDAWLPHSLDHFWTHVCLYFNVCRGGPVSPTGGFVTAHLTGQ